MSSLVPSSPRVRVISCLGVELELAFLPHFLAHYQSLGVRPEDIHVILNAADPTTPALAEAEAILAERGAAPPERWIAPYTSDAMWAERRAVQARVAAPDDWILNADADEHHAYPALPAEIAGYCTAKGYDCVQGVMIERFAADGTLAAVRPEPGLAEQFPVAAEAAIALFGRRRGSGLDGTVKLMLHRGSVFPSRGGHNPIASDERPPSFLAGARLATFPGAEEPRYRLRYPFRVDHYNWTATRGESLRRRMATPGVSEAGRAFGEQVLAYLDRHGGVRMEDVAVGPSAPHGGGWRRRMLGMRLAARMRYRMRRLPIPGRAAMAGR